MLGHRPGAAGTGEEEWPLSAVAMATEVQDACRAGCETKGVKLGWAERTGRAHTTADSQHVLQRDVLQPWGHREEVTGKVTGQVQRALLSSGHWEWTGMQMEDRAATGGYSLIRPPEHLLTMY